MLVDTCVISEVRNPRGDQYVRDAFIALNPNHVHLSVVTIGELRKGVELAPAGDFKRVLAESLARIETIHSDRVLPIDRDVAHIWGEITARARLNGYVVSASDGLIAATAIRHGLTVMTRNVKDFEPTGVLLANPWD
jgi:predicted nucleic acid-binding protein